MGSCFTRSPLTSANPPLDWSSGAPTLGVEHFFMLNGTDSGPCSFGVAGWEPSWSGGFSTGSGDCLVGCTLVFVILFNISYKTPIPPPTPTPIASSSQSESSQSISRRANHVDATLGSNIEMTNKNWRKVLNLLWGIATMAKDPVRKQNRAWSEGGGWAYITSQSHGPRNQIFFTHWYSHTVYIGTCQIIGNSGYLVRRELAVEPSG